MSKLTEPYWKAWLYWRLYRRFKGERYRQYWLFRKFVHDIAPGGLMIDCGANAGEVSKLFLDKGFMVHAFEPDPAALAVLERAFGSNPKLVIHRQAVSTAPGRLVLHRTADASGPSPSVSSSLVRRDIHSEAQGVEVEVIDLFAFMDGLGRKVDVLKMDIEGAEADILEEMLRRRYDRKIGTVLVETHERFSPDLARRIGEVRRQYAALGVTNVNLDWV